MCLKPTLTDKMSCPAGTAPGDVWREVAANSKSLKVFVSNAHTCLSDSHAPPRLKSSQCFFS